MLKGEVCHVVFPEWVPLFSLNEDYAIFLFNFMLIVALIVNQFLDAVLTIHLLDYV